MVHAMSTGKHSARGQESSRRGLRLAAALTGLMILGACEEGPGLAFLKPKAQEDGAVTPSSSTRLVEREVEAPEVFQVTEAGLWDGRPSLGGVWVAHPDAEDPEQVIIRNQANGKFVIGALFRREREIPGPRLQVSSDASEALGMLAGAPVELNVTALRSEKVADPEQAAEVILEDADVALADGGDIDTQPLDPIAGAAAAIDAAVPTATAPTQAAAPAVTTAATKAAAASSSLSKPYIQIGIFSVEANAKRTADQMRNAGLLPSVLSQSSNGKPFWRVLVGPAQSKSERSQLLKSVKDVGFSDAYAVTN
ncbi:SPOR domain-containing protein [Phaeobacter inhibens]|uniref:SPOR domain-containing protein n=1 Tax=Phaeobacter inhibens TaxID=221822 RepID=UPI0021A5A4D1|nr:SPOR domain-containing protein [Phaeobacter inhibens]UWR96926.1 SPOR domain-containing protein [Phaeobacter inhibens]